MSPSAPPNLSSWGCSPWGESLAHPTHPKVTIYSLLLFDFLFNIPQFVKSYSVWLSLTHFTHFIMPSKFIYTVTHDRTSFFFMAEWYSTVCICTYRHSAYMSFPGGISGKESTCQNRRHRRLVFDPWVRKIPWRRKWWPSPVFLPGESHGQGSLAG